MKLTIESTDAIVHIDGVPARIWEGVSEEGTAVFLYVTRIAVPVDGDCTRMDAELKACRPPSPEVLSWPARMVL